MVRLPPLLQTPLLAQLGCTLPVMLAGMGGVARHQLAAAVINAGGFGVLGMVREPIARIRAEVNALRERCTGPFAVNLVNLGSIAIVVLVRFALYHAVVFRVSGAKR